MNNTKKYIVLVIITLASHKSFGQQTVQLSQYMFNGLAVNPAYAGYKEDWTLNLSSRLQWAGINGAPKTSNLSIDGVTNADIKSIGLGLLVTNDRIGPQNNSSAYVNYAYRLRFDDEDTQRLCFGIAAGLIQYNVDGALFNAADVGDTNIPAGTQSKLTPDFRVGVYYYSPSVYVGASVLNVFPETGSNANNIIINQVSNYYLTGGIIVPITSTIDWKPSVMFKEDFKGPTNLELANFLIFNNKLWLGAAYSTAVTLWNKTNLQNDLYKSDAFTAIIEVNITDRCRFGYSYDFSTSKLLGNQSGSHEVSLSLSFGRKNPRILSPRYF